MGLLRLAVLGPPEVFHEGRRLTFALRKAQALLLYLAVEGGLHPRSKLAALLWPDSDPADARKTLRNAITLLRSLLADADASASHSHLLAEQDLLGLNPQAPLELDLEVVQQAWHQAQRLSTVPSQEQRAALVTQLQQALALVRGPFLDGFWLREETGFDQWHEQQRQVQVYTTCRARFAEELRVQPSAETVALAERIRATAAASLETSPARRATATAGSQPPGELVAPLIGRAAAFSQLVGSFQRVRQGKTLAVLLVGEAGIGKTRLAREFGAWAFAQGAEVLSGQAFEMGGRLPYQPLVEALRPRLEAENAPEDLLEDLWLAELSRLLPELRVRYPDLPVPTEDELTAKLRLFEAVARLLDALARSAPLVLLLDDLHWVDGAIAQVYGGQVLDSIRSGRRALALSREIKNVWLEINSTNALTYGLLDAGAYEEALRLMQHTYTLARAFPPTINTQSFLIGLGSVYHALQQWEEARSTLEEAEAMAGTVVLRSLQVSMLSQLCMHSAVAREWEAACRYALNAVVLRKSFERAWIVWGFYFHYETESLVRGGEESQAQAAVQRLGERLGSNRRSRIPYLRSLAVLAAWDGHSEQATGHLVEAAQLAADLELPGEQWQIQSALGSLYEAEGEQGQAHTTFAEAARIIQGSAEGIKDGALRTRFLAGPQIQPVVQHARDLANRE